MAHHLSARCTARVAADADCGLPVPDDAPVTICGQHMIEAYRFCMDSMRAAGHVNAAPVEAHLATTPVRKPYVPIVYYVSLGRHIKIGTTTHFKHRMGALLPEKVLAVEPGGTDVERIRHRQFGHLLVPIQRGKELFQRGADLLEHIEVVAAEYGRPRVTLDSEHNRWQRHIDEVLAGA